MLHLAKTTRDSRDARALRARRDYKLAVTRSLRPLASRELKISSSARQWPQLLQNMTETRVQTMLMSS